MGVMAEIMVHLIHGGIVGALVVAFIAQARRSRAKVRDTFPDRWPPSSAVVRRSGAGIEVRRELEGVRDLRHRVETLNDLEHLGHPVL